MSVVEFNMDLSNVGAMMGSITGMTEAVNTKVYILDLVEAAQHYMGTDFNNFMTVLAASQPERFHHVYEWGHVAEPGYRLWRNVYVGTAATNRVTSFEFLPSHTEVPLPDPPFPPGPNGQQVNRRYVFWNKARVMEYNIPTHIRLVAAKALFINLRDQVTNLDDEGKGFTFASQATIFNQGGGHTAGSFTNAFLTFYREQGPRIFNERIRPIIERSTENIVLESGAASRRGRVGKRSGWKSYEIFFDAAREMARSETLTSAAAYKDTAYAEGFKRAFG